MAEQTDTSGRTATAERMRPAVSTAYGPVRCLSIHADYRCQHSGACCTNGWAVPVEVPLYERLGEAVRTGRIRVPSPLGPVSRRTGAIVQEAAGLPDGHKAVLAHAPTGSCIFFDAVAGNLCAIHRDAGHDWLPSACRHFPRICLLDPRGVFVSLSHYCPTAARMLLRDDCPLAIVEDPPGYDRRFDYEGLDAREALPPLLRPDALFDWNSYDRYERYLVDTLARDDLSPAAALGLLVAVTEVVRDWREPLSLDEHIRRATESPAPVLRVAGDLGITPMLYKLVLASVAPGLRRPRPLRRFGSAYRRWVEPAWRDFGRPIRRYLAAKGFANWSAYQGSGARTILFSMVVALAVLRVEAARVAAAARRPLDEALLVEAFRQADLLLVHMAGRERLAQWFSRIETEPAEHLLFAIGPE
jgi:Fe-S-cluster containining protein